MPIVPYEAPTAANAHCARMHLSNTSVNTKPPPPLPRSPSCSDSTASSTQVAAAVAHEQGEEEEEGGDDGDAASKATLAQAMAELARGGVDTIALWAHIRDTIVAQVRASPSPPLHIFSIRCLGSTGLLTSSMLHYGSRHRHHRNHVHRRCRRCSCRHLRRARRRRWPDTRMHGTDRSDGLRAILPAQQTKKPRKRATCRGRR